MHQKKTLIVLLLAILMLPKNGNSQEEKKFKPTWSVGTSLTWTSVLDHRFDYQVYGLELGYNLSLIKRKTFNLSLESVVGIGRATPSLNLFKSDRFAQSADIALLARKRIGKFHFGFGWVSGFTNISDDYFYWGYLGLTGRLGYQIHPNFLLEAKGNLQTAYAETKAVAGLSLIWLK